MSEVRQDQRYCRIGRCRAEVRLARSASTGNWFILDADDMPPTTHGALVLIGDTAFTLPSAVAHLAGMFDIDDADAYTKALTEYGWHLPHVVTCAFRRRR